MTGYQSKKAAAQDKLDSMEREALKLALKALEGFIPYLPLWDKNQCNRYDLATTAINEALAQPEQERNFCERCGKRTADLTVIHTCTPPQEKNT